MTDTEIILQKYPVILFDDTCILCNRAVQFILKHEGKVPFYFIPLQSPELKKVPGLIDFSEKADSLILLYHGHVRFYSDAVLKIAGLLGFPWNIAVISYLVPGVLRNKIYRWIASNRHHWFGATDTCRVLKGKFANRFLGVSYSS
ncbi:MAG TPA: DCC1-like thiol-disulfide oxidoreductase family protein [Bacteroidales bacterium]|nr:DCC1-like thiol-disulfide oxidoreductase family protein [Bacteroidales bacterium]HQK37067.1 DCC1-like thiol-disulfide oxidoreductase family protein [Bacteroidales bacterium]